MVSSRYLREKSVVAADVHAAFWPTSVVADGKVEVTLEMVGHWKFQLCATGFFA